MGSMKDTYSELKLENFLTPQTIDDSGGDVESDDIDLQDFNSALIAISAAQSGDASPDFTIKVEHKDESGDDYEDVEAGHLLGVDSVSDGVLGGSSFRFDDGSNGIDIGSDDGEPHTAVFGYIGGKRFVRITVEDNGSNSTGTIFSGVIAKGHPRLAPVQQL
ncbi:MAG: hypothetical protein ACLFPA_10520 [Dichotomicrobium sp.]